MTEVGPKREVEMARGGAALDTARERVEEQSDRRSAERRALTERRWLGHPFLVDLFMLTLGMAVATLYDGRVTVPGFGWSMLFLGAMFATMYVRGLYDFRLQVSPLDDVSRILSATSISTLVLLSTRVAAGSPGGATGEALRLWAGTTVFLSTGRLALAVYVRRQRRQGRAQLPTLILGAEDISLRIARRLRERPELGLRPIGFVDDSADDVRVIGQPEDLTRVIREHGASHVIVGFASAPPESLLEAIRTCRELGVDVSVVPRLFEEVNRRMDVDHLGGIPLLRFRHVHPKGWQFAIKYALDRVIAALLLLLLAPLMLLIAVLVKLSSPGPVLFRQPRVGLDGCQFTMYKFRTMRGDDKRDGVWNAGWAAAVAGEDAKVVPVDRRTRIGRVLRATSLDELPQLINVVRGDMSLVGPRPEQVPFVQTFSERVYRYPDRHRVKCGVTGWAQVHGLRGNTSLADRVEWDNWYIENWSLWLDFKVLFMTVPAVFSRRGAV